jgi:hypothetical protein
VSVEADLRTFLLTLNTVTALVGTGDAARIRPDVLWEEDDKTEEAIIIEVDNEDILTTIDGKGGRRMADVTLRCRARTKAEARALSEAVRVNGADPGTGMAGMVETINGTVYDAWLEDEQLSATPVAEGSDQFYYDVFSNYRVTWLETT